MSVLKNVFARIWAVWGIIIFAILMLMVFPFFLVCMLWKEPKRSHISYRIFRIWMNIYLPFIGVFIKIKGKENFEKGKNYIVLCNHNSFMDVPVSSPYVVGANKTIAKIEMSRIPIFGMIYKLGSVLVDRKDKDSRVKSYILMKDVLAMGLHMIIYPEGTRNKTGKPMKEFHDGAFKLAVDTLKPILPAVLFGTARILPNNKSFYLLPGKVEFHFLPAINVKPGDNADSLKQQAFDLMWEEYAGESSQ